MKHYTEVDLLEMAYSPGAGAAVSHLRECTACRGRFDSLQRKLRGVREDFCSDNRPETFWLRQRRSILKKIDLPQEGTAWAFPFTRLAAAAIMAAMLITGAFMVNGFQGSSAPSQQTVQQAAQPAPTVEGPDVLDEIALVEDPWESDELRGYGEAVKWESWMAVGQTREDGTL